MGSLKDLDLKPDVTGVTEDWTDLPEQMGTFADPPQPGRYRIAFPSAGAIANCWDVIEVTKPEPGQRVTMILQGEAACAIRQSLLGRYNGEPLETRISNAERKRGKDDTKLASDLDYALVATKYPGKKPARGANREYIAAAQHLANREVNIDWEFSWYCNDKKFIRVNDPANGIQVLDGQDGKPEQKGCGKRYYMKDVQKIPSEKYPGEMEFPVRITCECDAELRAYGQIGRFSEVSEGA